MVQSKFLPNCRKRPANFAKSNFEKTGQNNPRPIFPRAKFKSTFI